MNLVMLQQAVVLIASVIIIARSEPAINRMSGCTPMLVRLSFLALTIGAAAEIVSIVTGTPPGWPDTIIISGVAALLLCEKRMRILCPAVPRRKKPT